MVMADVLLDSEHRVHSDRPPPPPPHPTAGDEPMSQVLGRLDQIDLRLQEQQQRRPSHAKSLPAAMQHVQVRGDLMNRLNLMEPRIRQLSCELGLDCGGGVPGKAVHHQLGLGLGTSSSSVPPVEDPATWSDSAPVAVVDPAFGGGKVESKPAAEAGGSWSAVDILHRGAHQLHRSTSSIRKPNPTYQGEETGRSEMGVPEGEEEGGAQQVPHEQAVVHGWM